MLSKYQPERLPIYASNIVLNLKITQAFSLKDTVFWKTSHQTPMKHAIYCTIISIITHQKSPFPAIISPILTAFPVRLLHFHKNTQQTVFSQSLRKETSKKMKLSITLSCRNPSVDVKQKERYINEKSYLVFLMCNLMLLNTMQ